MEGLYNMSDNEQKSLSDIIKEQKEKTALRYSSADASDIVAETAVNGKINCTDFRQ